MIASNIAKRESMRTTGEEPNTKYINVSSDTVPTRVQLNTGSNIAYTKVVISPAIRNEVIVSRDDLKQLKVIPNEFPASIMVISQERFNEIVNIRHKLISDNPTVLTDDLPNESMEGCVMKIYLTPGEKKPFWISTARQVPLHWKEKAEQVVTKLLKERVITRQDEPTEWCTPVFFVIKKNSDLRLVVDYTQLNKHVSAGCTLSL